MFRILLIGVCLFTVFSVGCTDDIPNMIQNPGFEELDENGWAVGWEIWPEQLPEPNAVIIDREAPDGRQALRLRHDKITSYTRAQQRVAIEPGGEYFFSFYYLTEMVEFGEGAQGARMFIERAGGGSRASRRLGGSSMEWQRVTVGPVTFGDATEVTVMCYLHQSSGTVWYDDISMVKATPEWAGRIKQERSMKIFDDDTRLGIELATEVNDGAAVAAIRELRSRYDVTDMPSEHDLRAGPPYFIAQSEFLTEMASLNARRLPQAGGLIAWEVPAIAPMSHFGLVPAVHGRPVSTLMGRGETHQVAVNLCNLTDAPQRVRVTFRSEGNAPRPHLMLREAFHVQTRHDTLLADPLPRLGPNGQGGFITLPPGLFKQVWLMIDSRGVPAGEYSAAIEARTLNDVVEIPVRIEVAPVDFPTEVPIITWGYSYEHWPLIKDRWTQALADLIAHHNNAFCWPARYLPWPTFDAEGNLEPLDWTNFDEGLETHSNIRWLLLWTGFEWENNLKLRDEDLEVGSEEWERRFILWFRAMIEGLRERGFGYDRAAWYLADEPCSWPRANAVAAAGEVIRKADPQALITANPYSAATWDMLRKMDPVVDIWCPELKWAEDEYLKFFQDGSKILWSYQVLAKEAPAFTHYRRSFWDNWAKGSTGQGYWCYADLGGSNWDPLDGGRVDYAVVYDGDDDELIPSVRWEAWREGIEDYTYLWLLAQAAKEGHGTAAQRAQAQQILGPGVAEIARTESPEDLEAMRIQVLRLLSAMQP